MFFFSSTHDRRSRERRGRRTQRWCGGAAKYWIQWVCDTECSNYRKVYMYVCIIIFNMTHSYYNNPTSIPCLITALRIFFNLIMFLILSTGVTTSYCCVSTIVTHVATWSSFVSCFIHHQYHRVWGVSETPAVISLAWGTCWLQWRGEDDQALLHHNSREHQHGSYTSSFASYLALFCSHSTAVFIFIEKFIYSCFFSSPFPHAGKKSWCSSPISWEEASGCGARRCVNESASASTEKIHIVSRIEKLDTLYV